MNKKTLLILFIVTVVSCKKDNPEDYKPQVKPKLDIQKKTANLSDCYKADVAGNIIELQIQNKAEVTTGTLTYVFSGNEVSQGTEAGVGGNVTWRTGSLALEAGRQQYDMNAWASSSGIEAGDLEIKRIFFEEPPAIVRYFDPYAGTGVDIQALMDTFDFGNYSPGINFLLMPINYDLQKIQAIEFNDQVRKSNFSFELINNQLRIFPIPERPKRLAFQYILKSDRVTNGLVTGDKLVTDVSNVPYTNPQYRIINSVGRQWIFEYTLALCKEMLGYVRGKYGPIPIPGAEVTLNQADLLAAATAEKNALIDRLRAYLDETSRRSLLERRKDEAEFRRTEFGNVPFTIYIG